MSSAGSSTDGDAPMTVHDALDGLLNTITELIRVDGYDDIRTEFDALCESVEGIDEILRDNFDAVYRQARDWNEMFKLRPRAFQQLIYILKVVGVEKNIWKRLVPRLVFARLTQKALEGAERWVPPRRRRKRARDESKKKLAGISYMVSIRKMLREAIEEKNSEAVEQIMKAMQDNLPFGSVAHLSEGVQEFRMQAEKQSSLLKTQKKIRHCYYAKVGRNALPKLADEHFCTVHRRFLLPYRHPKRIEANSMTEELRKVVEESSDEDSDW
jgi:hypothetical protein